MRYCSNCGGYESGSFCGKCGTETSSFPRCKNCGSEINPSDSNCTSCGWNKNDRPVPVVQLPGEVANKKSQWIISKLRFVFAKQEREELKEPFPIVVVEFPEKVGKPISELLYGIQDPPPNAFKSYKKLTDEIKRKVCAHPDLYALPDIGKERVVGWAIDGERVFDEISDIDTGSHGSTFSASGYAYRIKKTGGVVMAWLKKDMYIWPVELVIYGTNQCLGSI